MAGMPDPRDGLRGVISGDIVYPAVMARAYAEVVRPEDEHALAPAARVPSGGRPAESALPDPAVVRLADTELGPDGDDAC
jgi:hypothetical protein